MSRVVAFAYDRVIDRRIVLQLRLLQQHGHQVQLYTVAGDAATDPADIPIHRLPPPQARNGFAGMVFRLLDVLRAHAPGLLRRVMPLARPIAWRMLRADPAASYLQLFAPALAEAPAADLTIAYDLPMLAVGAAHKAAQGGTLLYDSHELFSEQAFSGFEQRMWARTERAYIAQADAVMTINPSVAAELQRRYGLPQVHVVENAELLPDALPPRRPYFQQHFGLPENSVIALFQGALSADRNLHTLVASMQHVTHPNLHLVLLGDGPLRVYLQQQAQRLGVQVRVHFHAAVPQDALIATSMMADFGVIPYVANCLNNALCSPNKLYEFMIAGLPILGSDLPEIRRVVEAHGIGMVRTMDTPASIAAALDRMADPASLQAWRAAVAVARTQCNWQVESQRFLTVIENLLLAHS